MRRAARPSSPPSPLPERAEAHRLTLAGTRALTVGAMLGVGIFIAPPQAARSLSGARPLISLWILAILLALCGARVYAHLAARDPRSGGDFNYLQRAYGEATARWATLFLLLGGFLLPCAALGDALGRYQLPTLFALAEPSEWTRRILGALTLTALSLLQLAGLRAADRFQRVSTRVPVYLLALLALYTFAAPPLSPPEIASAPLPAPAGSPLSAWVAAFLPIWFAFSGWNAPVYCAGEVENCAEALPRAMSQGVLFVGGLYLLIVAALIIGLGFEGLAAAGEAGSALATRLAGERAARLMNGLIALALLGTINATLLGAGRLLVASFLPRWSKPRATCSLGLLGAALILTLPSPGELSYAGLVMLLLGLLTLSTALRFWWLERRAPAPPALPISSKVLAAVCLYGLAVLVILGVKLTSAFGAEGGDFALWLSLIFFSGLCVTLLRDLRIIFNSGASADPSE